LLTWSVVFVGLGELAAAATMSFNAVFVILPLVSFSAMLFTTTANTSVQLATDPGVRARVLAIYTIVLLGGTPIGASLVGYVAHRLSPRVGSAACGAVSVVAAAVVRPRGAASHG
jgi:hypothetical protein